jgi:outer membrane protein TolC
VEGPRPILVVQREDGQARSVRQAMVNLQVSEKRGSKVKADFGFEVAQTFYKLLGAQTSIKLHEELVGKTLDFWQRTQRRFEEGLLTRLELLSVGNQLEQAKFQRLSADNDLILARLKLLQRMSLPADAPLEFSLELAPIEPPEIDLEEILKFSVQYRPDIHVNSLLVQFHEFEERIAKAKGKLKLDLSGFLGVSGAAFETEPLDLGKDYFIGIKASQAWGPHGASVSANTTKTSPRLGQSTRTDSTVYQGELGILNQLGGLSEVKQAAIGLEKARHDLEEVKQTVFQEVEEAYLSYKRARLQLEYARKKIAFREEQVKILEAQAGLNEVLPSQVMEAMMRLYDERLGEMQAMVNLEIALSKINKAIGLPGHYR